MPDCVFCKIIRGELPSIRIYEDDAAIAILTIQPSNPGHTLVMPKKHAANVFEATPELWCEVQETVRKTAHAIEKAMNPDGININMNNREHAGQSVHHIHIHLIPRFKDDGLKPWAYHNRTTEEGEPIAEKIRAAFNN